MDRAGEVGGGGYCEVERSFWDGTRERGKGQRDDLIGSKFWLSGFFKASFCPKLGHQLR